MTSSYKVLDYADIAGSLDLKESFAFDVLMGLSDPKKNLPSKYFYDDEGSRLFRKITTAAEYYIPSSELEIFRTHKNKISDLLSDRKFNLIELGPGDGHKTIILLEQFVKQGLDFHYVPIDISEAAMQDLTAALSKNFPKLEVRGLVSEYSNGVKWISQSKDRHNFVLFLGSNIGNFNQARARVFLRSLWNSLNHNDLVLIGFDLKKDIDLMLRAYNDSHGYTRDFNLNLLTRINRELGGNFDISKFRHFAHYDVFSGAMESYLVSKEEQTVFIEEIGARFQFKPWEPIHTEFSYKFHQNDIETLASETGFTIEMQLYDSKQYYTDSIWCVNKPVRSEPRES